MHQFILSIRGGWVSSHKGHVKGREVVKDKKMGECEDK